MNINELDNVIQFKRILSKCVHERFIVDERLSNVECAQCGVSINPIHALKMVAGYMARIQRKKEEIKKYEQIVDEKSRVKCGHCNKFTTIKRS